jgi:mono/diheme cytochrome c family protein
MIRSFSLLVGLLVLLVVSGCGKSEPSGTGSPAPPNPMAGPGGPSSGNGVFDMNCANCHAVTAPESGGKKRKGPNLSKVGATRSKEWLADHVKNPTTHKPGSTMPPFEQKLSADDIKSVSEFMASLK